MSRSTALPIWGLTCSLLMTGLATAAPAPPELHVRALPKGSDFHIINVCSHAARLAVRVLELRPESADARLSLALEFQKSIVKDGKLEEQTPGVTEVVLAMTTIEALLANGQMPAPGQMHDWFVAQVAATCARTFDAKPAS